MQLFTSDQIEAAFMEAGFKAEPAATAQVFLWNEASVESLKVNILESLVSYVQDNYAANNMTGKFMYWQKPAPDCTEIKFKFIHEDGPVADPIDSFDMDNLNFDVDESRLAEMQNAGMDVPEDDTKCDGCTI